MINLDYRKNGIGGSELAAMLGLSGYKTPLDIYLEKTGQSAPFEGNQYTLRGSRLEPVVAQYLQDAINADFENGKVLTVSELFETYPNFEFSNGKRSYENGVGTDTIVSNEFSYMFASPDRFVVFENEICGAELKTTNDYSLKTADDVIEKHIEWLFQCQYCMQITGLKSWFIAWVSGFDMQLYYFKVDFNAEIAAEISEKVTDFWVNNVIAELPPEPQTYEDCMNLYPFPTDDPPLEATNELYAVLQQYESLKATARSAEAEAEALRDRIACAVGNSSLITYGGQKVATYKRTDKFDLDKKLFKSEMPDLYDMYCKPSWFRVLRITKPKAEK